MIRGRAGWRIASMSHDQLRQLVPGLERTLGPPLRGRDDRESWLVDELRLAWRAAHEASVDAYRVWQRSRGGETYTVYRAAQDRADAAQDALALSATRSG
jgi:hypothetical protein